MTKLIQIEGLGSQSVDTLEQFGIQSVEQLLEAGKTPELRTALSQRTGIDERYIIQWVRRADLVRVKGVGNEYADLLDVAGIQTVPGLAKTTPEYIHQKLTQVNRVKRLVRRIPAMSRIALWVESAKDLPPIVIQ